jgi:CDGSH-type Zn-finger protein
MATITITGRKNGSVRVPGPITLHRPNGEEVRIDKETVGLCRCGASKDKPLCDGTHREIGFEADEFTLHSELPATDA